MVVVEGRRVSGEEEAAPQGIIVPMQDNAPIPPPPRPRRGHSQEESLISRASNRLSLSLPIQVWDGSHGRPTRYTATDSDPPVSEASPLLNIEPNTSFSASSEFLVVLAAQERRVLELKEELHRAESKLKKLKRQWAQYEANRNIGRLAAEIKPVELQPIQPIVRAIDGTAGDKEDDKHMRRSVNIDEDRRKTVLAAPTKDSRRKVIRGGHTKALSLLSPIQGSFGQYTSPSTGLDSRKEHSAVIGELPSPPYPTKSSSNKVRHSYQDSASIGVKRIAEDIRSGLWTFMEDLRQATVGDEAVKRLPPSNTNTALKGLDKKGSRGNSMSADQRAHGSPRERTPISRVRETGRGTSTALIDAGESREGDEMAARMSIGTEERLETANSLDDNWSNWDSPVSNGDSGRWSNSTALSSQDTNSEISSSNESKAIQHTLAISSSDPRRDEIAWSALNNFTPSNIKRTASAIIKEWEKSLAPLSNERNDVTRNFSSLAKKTNEEESKLLLNNLS